MDFHRSRLRDWRGRDGYEPVGYLSVSRPVKDPTGLVDPESGKPLPVQAHRRNLTLREKAASGGVYTDGALVWLVPVELLGEALRCKPADVLTDRDGAEHVVQAAQLNNYRTQWRLETLDLSLAHDLRDTVQIERASIGTDAAGAYVKTFPPAAGGIVLYADVPARVQLVTEEIQDTRGQRSFVGTHMVIVGRQVAVTNEDRVKWVDPGGATRYLDIKGLHNPQRIDELPVIDAELRP